jgi:sugar phosphate permease
MPLCGLSRAPYILNATLCGCAAFFVIGSAPEDQLEITTVVACLLVIQLQISVTDLLIEARYSEVIQEKCPDKATTVVGFVQASITMGGILATLSASGAIQFLGTRRCYLVLLVLVSFIIVPLMCNYMEEKPRSVEEVTLIRKRLAAQPQLIFLCLVFFLI